MLGLEERVGKRIPAHAAVEYVKYKIIEQCCCAGCNFSYYEKTAVKAFCWSNITIFVARVK